MFVLKFLLVSVPLLFSKVFGFFIDDDTVEVPDEFTGVFMGPEKLVVDGENTFACSTLISRPDGAFVFKRSIGETCEKVVDESFGEHFRNVVLKDIRIVRAIRIECVGRGLGKVFTENSGMNYFCNFFKREGNKLTVAYNMVDSPNDIPCAESPFVDPYTAENVTGRTEFEAWDIVARNLTQEQYTCQ
eukprot:TRINITY_DN2771_c5_g1_i1.p2 TRINITY_DN2771_c5_g1~~TRINITY_DN2771_c5_g1_i1.p2  ORF type:complete len:188 (-),score=22.35 TRINITY_DN2771_c5_g1_i1:560-1123(-)